MWGESSTRGWLPAGPRCQGRARSAKAEPRHVIPRGRVAMAGGQGHVILCQNQSWQVFTSAQQDTRYIRSGRPGHQVHQIEEVRTPGASDPGRPGTRHALTQPLADASTPGPVQAGFVHVAGVNTVALGHSQRTNRAHPAKCRTRTGKGTLPLKHGRRPPCSPDLVRRFPPNVGLHC